MRTDRHDEDNSRFRNFANAPKNSHVSWSMPLTFVFICNSNTGQHINSRTSCFKGFSPLVPSLRIPKFNLIRRVSKIAKSDYLRHNRLSAWNNSSPTGRIFIKLDILSFRKSAEKIKFALKSEKNKRHFTWRRFYIYDNILLNSFWNEKYFRQNVWRQPKHTLLFKKFFFENRAVFEIVSRNKLEPEGPQITSQYGACWIIKATYTHPPAHINEPGTRTHARASTRTHTHTHTHTHKYIILIAFPRQQWSRMCLSVTLYVHWLSCY
jgi:hypothetical protein